MALEDVLKKALDPAAQIKFMKGEQLAEPASYKKVQNELSQYLIQKTYKDLGNQKAFVLRRLGTMSGDIYKMYINSTEHPNVQKYLETHEAGHIIFGHNSGETTKDRINKIKIKAAWPKVQDRFDDPEKWASKFDSIIYNIVMDMEVNSKLFTKEEFDNFGDALGGKGIWPEDFHYPVGLDYNTYLNLVLRDPQKFLDDYNEIAEQNGDDSEPGDGLEDGDDDVAHNDYDSPDKDGGNQSDDPYQQKGDGGTKDGKESSSSSSGKNKKNGISKKALKELEKYYKENDEEEKQETVDRLEADEAKEMGVTPSNEWSEESSSYGHGGHTLNSVGMVSFKTIEKDLQNVVSKSTTMNKRDPIYNYNRNKHNSNVLIPRVSRYEKRSPACMYVLLDVSGSVAESTICRFVETFKKVSKKLNRKSRIILWDTGLVSDNSVLDEVVPESGGGTLMARGMHYIQKTYHPSAKDYFFVVSDFQDDLDEWDVELQKMKCNKSAYIFDYGNTNEECAARFETMGDYLNGTDWDEIKALWKHTKGINIAC